MFKYELRCNKCRIRQDKVYDEALDGIERSAMLLVFTRGQLTASQIQPESISLRSLLEGPPLIRHNIQPRVQDRHIDHRKEGDERQSVWRLDTKFDKLTSTILEGSMTNDDVKSGFESAGNIV